jgi:succinate-semialdehyde dehydrogenase/glutarate-semialdehyde dehydrogenase
MISEKNLLAKIPTQLYIDGAWVDATGGKTIPVSDPATGEVLAHIADAQPEDGIRCLDAAVAAQDAWAQTAPRVRGELLRKAFDRVHELKEEFALLMTIEMGKPLAEALVL